VQQRQGDHASQWAATSPVAAKIGCIGERLRSWRQQGERDSGIPARRADQGATA